jgi:quinolinate synthase
VNRISVPGPIARDARRALDAMLEMSKRD